MADVTSMRFGCDFDDVEGSSFGRGPLPDPGINDFEITKVSGGAQSKGKNVGAPYISLKCAQVSGETPGTKSASQFLGFGTVPFANGSCQKAQMKGFLEGIGRHDLLRPDASPTELIGTVFRANAVLSKDQKGQDQVDFYDLEPVSHAFEGSVIGANAPMNQPMNRPQPVAQQDPAVLQQPVNQVQTAQPAPQMPQAPTQAPAAGARTRRVR